MFDAEHWWVVVWIFLTSIRTVLHFVVVQADVAVAVWPILRARVTDGDSVVGPEAALDVTHGPSTVATDHLLPAGMMVVPQLTVRGARKLVPVARFQRWS